MSCWFSGGQFVSIWSYSHAKCSPWLQSFNLHKTLPSFLLGLPRSKHTVDMVQTCCSAQSAFRVARHNSERNQSDLRWRHCRKRRKQQKKISRVFSPLTLQGQVFQAEHTTRWKYLDLSELSKGSPTRNVLDQSVQIIKVVHRLSSLCASALLGAPWAFLPSHLQSGFVCTYSPFQKDRELKTEDINH